MSAVLQRVQRDDRAMRSAEEPVPLKREKKNIREGGSGDLISRESLAPTRNGAMAMWRERVFIAMSKNANTASSHFHIPPNQVVELGACVEI